MSELFYHMGMLGLQKGQIFGSIYPCNCILFYIVEDAQITLFCLLVPRSGVRLAIDQLPCCGEEFLYIVVQLSLRCSRAWRRLNVMVGSDSEASEVACLASWSAQLFPGMSLCPGHHAIVRVLFGFFSSHWSIFW